MKAKILLALTLFALPVLTASAGEATIPQGHPVERYERIWKKSPFTVASVLNETPADTSTFTDNLTLVGLVTIGGKPLATVVANDSQETTLVDADTPNAAGLQVVSYINDLDSSKVQVVLKKGDSTGTLRFNISETPAAPQPVANVNPNSVPPPGNPPRIINRRPNIVPQTPGIVRPPTQPGITRRRTLVLPGSNRPTNPNDPQNNRPNPGNAIPPP